MRKESIMVDKLGGIDPTSKFNTSQKVKRVSEQSSKDSIALSNEARLKADYLKIQQEVNKIPDIRMDKVEEAKKKLASGLNRDESALQIANKILKEIEVQDESLRR